MATSDGRAGRWVCSSRSQTSVPLPRSDATSLATASASTLRRSFSPALAPEDVMFETGSMTRCGPGGESGPRPFMVCIGASNSSRAPPNTCSKMRLSVSTSGS